MSMAQVGREHGKTTFHVLPGAVPLDHRLDGESVPKVVETRAEVDFSLSQTDPAREFVEGPADGGGFQRAPEIGDQEGVAAAGGKKRMTLLCIVTQSANRGRVKRYEARFPKLGLADSEDSRLKIDILLSQGQGFADAQARYGQKTEETVVGVGPYSLRGPQARCSFQQTPNFVLGVKVRPGARRPVRQQSIGRDFRASVEGMLVCSEDTNGLHPICPGSWLLSRRAGRPFQGQGNGYVFCSLGFGKGGELPQQSPRATQFESQTVTQGKIILNGLAE
jgi:hypothetical protein